MKTSSENGRPAATTLLSIMVSFFIGAVVGYLAGRPPSSTSDDNSIRAAVQAVLRAQEEAWNRGDIDAFVEHYWKSDSLTFSSGGKTTRGWTDTVNRYRSRYPTPEKSTSSHRRRWLPSKSPRKSKPRQPSNARDKNDDTRKRSKRRKEK